MCIHMYRYMATGQVIGNWLAAVAAEVWVSQSVGFACIATPCTIGHAMALWVPKAPQIDSLASL